MPDCIICSYFTACSEWLSPKGFSGKVHSMDDKVGGSWRMSTDFTTSQPLFRHPTVISAGPVR